MDKQQLVARIVEQLAAELATLQAEVSVARENATGDEAKSEGKYDTRALESSYLADGQERRLVELGEEVAAWRALRVRDFGPGEPAAVGALLEVESRSGYEYYFMGPRSGGIEMPVDGRTKVMVITPSSPLGQKLLGRVAGDSVRLEAAREVYIHNVQ